MTVFTFDAKVAYSPATATFLPGVIGSFYLDTDTGFTTPLTVTPVGGSPTTSVTSTTGGLIPDFTLDQASPNSLTGVAGSRVVWKSGAHQVTLTSMPWVVSELAVLRDFMQGNGIRLVRYDTVAGAWPALPPTAQSWVRETWYTSTETATATSPLTATLNVGDKWFQHKDAA